VKKQEGVWKKFSIVSHNHWGEEGRRKGRNVEAKKRLKEEGGMREVVIGGRLDLGKQKRRGGGVERARPSRGRNSEEDRQKESKKNMARAIHRRYTA